MARTRGRGRFWIIDIWITEWRDDIHRLVTIDRDRYIRPTYHLDRRGKIDGLSALPYPVRLYRGAFQKAVFTTLVSLAEARARYGKPPPVGPPLSPGLSQDARLLYSSTNPTDMEAALRPADFGERLLLKPDVVT